ncbi:MAG: hypothetical protein J5I41_07325 [Saprospiraceae bacterium]|nr:hypothetical protein [Saprospiraceae bacterium]
MSSYPYARQIRALRADTHREVIRFFERHAPAIRHGDPAEYAESYMMYLDALFACGMYDRFLQQVDEGLHLALDHRLQSLEEGDLYLHLLYRKAAACYHLDRSDASIHILRQILRLAPDHQLARRFLTARLAAAYVLPRQRLRAVAIGSFLLAVAASVLHLLMIRPFLPAWSDASEWVRQTALLAGVLTWGGGEVVLHLRARRETRRWLATCLRKRQARPETSRSWH